MKIDKKICVGCGGCVNLCPAQAIIFIDDRAAISDESCTDCGLCLQICGVRAPQK